MEESLREMDVKLSDVLGHRSAGSSQSELVQFRDTLGSVRITWTLI